MFFRHTAVCSGSPPGIRRSALPPDRSLLVLQPRSFNLGLPGRLLDIHRIDLLELFREMGKPLFEFFDVWSSQAAQFLIQLPMSPRLVEAARRSVGIMGSVAVRDRLCPLRGHIRGLVQELLSPLECRLSLEQLRASLPSLVVGVLVDALERLRNSLLQWAGA